ncbi:MAG: exodeoxyribonuclease VII large subunit [Candidatus Binatus sp.]|uniref:exodeoxyribonuclease VII large subunit n=1 Tax=Candidatus Binatus sp. TaxID=2811406 RepID=UPI0027211808|nr:exodeoxyribonuclease VII large subunit [Candidatus Binatus sp.]MDO8432903.1 exodeoxyribonuclease VII large subunit [Candidatus Binatus sp.]
MDGQLDLVLRGRRSGLISVSDLLRRVRDALESNLDEYWVVGEISNARLAPSNHFYFTLKDQRGAISAVMFKSAFTRLRFKITDGMEVIVRGRVSIFDSRGALQLYAEEMEPRGVGALQVAFEQLKRRLEAEGLFEQARKRPLPYLPRVVGIVTARGGAGLADMLRVMLDRFPNLRVLFRPAKVQGAGAADEIAAAIADLNRDGRAEVLIVGRGGGSLEDLWAFNEEKVARAIARSAIPVISAVGHEVDFTIADFVADLRAPTPTAAAHLVVPNHAELKERIANIEAAMRAVMEREISSLRETVDDFAGRLRHPRGLLLEARERIAGLDAELAGAITSRIAGEYRVVQNLSQRLRGPAAMIRELRAAIERINDRLTRGAQSALESRRRAVGAMAGKLDALSPLKVLERGYSVVINSRDGRAVLDAATVQIGDSLDITLAKGRLGARATARSS